MKKTIKFVASMAIAFTITICASAWLSKDERGEELIDSWSDGEPALRYA